MSDEKPKIIVDDDWKTRVQAEKELAAKGSSASAEPKETKQHETKQHETKQHETKQHETKQDAPLDEQLPPASLESLVSMLLTQALAALGQIPLGEKQELVLAPDHAKHYIDLLAMLEEKTKGNRTPAESEMLSRVLHELRMIFVAVQQQVAKAATRSPLST